MKYASEVEQTMERVIPSVVIGISKRQGRMSSLNPATSHNHTPLATLVVVAVQAKGLYL